MVDWQYVVEEASIVWEQFINWFLNIPLEVQVLVIIGAVASLILAGIIIYYVLKGVAYLIYYILKGVYLLLKALFTGFYKLFEVLYYAISGKPKPIKEVNKEAIKVPVYEKAVEENAIQREYQSVPRNALYCTDCGNKFTQSMHEQILQNGVAFCVNCGKGYRLQEVELAQY